MHSRPLHQHSHQRGFTLMEILVAVAIFATIMIVALLLYDRSNQVFKQSNEAAEMQQNTRVAYEKLVADLRMAGFDYKRAGTPTATTPAAWVSGRQYSVGTLVTPTTPNGHVYRAIDAGESGGSQPSWTTGTGDIINDKSPLRWQENGAPIYEQPDEQIEYSHTAAVTVRANFDYSMQGPDNGRETALETSSGGSFPVVTTGNDEIVTYALVSRDSSKNDDSITFYADVNDGGTPSRRAFPGGTAERAITITGVDLSNANPPYTLMRYTLNSAGEPEGTALSDNIRSMNITYWEDSAATRALSDLTNTPVTDVGGDGAYDPATPNAKVDGRIIRGKIRAMTVNVVGMNPQVDREYTHPTDTVAKNYRQYALVSTVVGRNLGMEGVPQNSNNPPGPPTVQSACNGYCGAAYITWKPDPGTVDATYTVLYDKSATGSFTGVLPAGTQTSYAVDLTQRLPEATTWYFKVAATNPYGTTVSKNSIAVDVRNATKPNAPVIDSVNAVAGKPNQLAVSWNSSTGNASGAPSCTAGAPTSQSVPAELKGYRVYRSMTPNFAPGDAGVVEVMNENTGGASFNGFGKWTFIDATVATCETYYYEVVAVEWCAAAAAYNTGTIDTALSDSSAEADGEATPAGKPRQPQNLKMHPDTVCSASAAKCYPVILTWDKVTHDVNNNLLNVVDYEIVRQKKIDGANSGSEEIAGTISDGATTFTEPGSLDYDLNQGKISYEYSVRAYLGYGNTATPGCNLESDPAIILVPDACSSGATILPDMLGPGSGTSADPFQNLSALQVIPYASKPVKSVQVILDGGAAIDLPDPFLYGYDDTGDGEVHTVQFTIVTEDCTEFITVYVQNDAPSCLLVGTVENVSGSTTKLDINVRSAADEEITIETIEVDWAGQSGYAWNSVTLSGSATPINTSGTPANPRTEIFTPTGASKIIAANGTYKITMNMTGTRVPLGAAVTGVRIIYTVVSTDDVKHECDVTPLGTCSLTGAVSFTDSTTLSVKLTNVSTEQIELSTLTIGWAGQAKLNWDRVVFPSGVSIATNLVQADPGTVSFNVPATDKVILGQGTYTVLMKFTTTFNNPPNPDPANITSATMQYTTPPSGTIVLGCRAY